MDASSVNSSFHLYQENEGSLHLKSLPPKAHMQKGNQKLRQNEARDNGFGQGLSPSDSASNIKVFDDSLQYSEIKINSSAKILQPEI